MSTPRLTISATSRACSFPARCASPINGSRMQPDRHEIALSVNGKSYRREVESRLLLSDFLRHELMLAGTHVGCEHGVCGACTILLDGAPARSCLLYAIQAQGSEITTIEAFGTDRLSTVQQALHEEHGLQCGFCTPGIVITMEAWLVENPDPTEAEIRDALSGNL